MDKIPGGTVTFLFTDIEGSTRKWETQAGMSGALERHDVLLRNAIEGNGGYVFKTVGDAFCAAFSDPLDGAKAALDSQVLLGAEPWTVAGGILVRMSLHSGVAQERDGDFFGPVLNRTARLLSLASGGQVLLSLATAELLHDHLPEGWELRPLGQFRLKDLSRPEAVSQLVAPGLRERFPVLKSLDRQPNNLPLQPSSFVGRGPELEAVRRALANCADMGADASCRLLTIIGPGGAGKTRLAVQAGAELLEGFEGGAWFIDLAGCTTAAQTAAEINRILSVREATALSSAQNLVKHLKDRNILLILDNLEQDLDAGSLVAEILGSCPGLAILATSREALRLRWERLLPLPPLGLPESGAVLDPARLRQYEAVALFIERAIAARPDFEVNAHNAPALAELCTRLDGIPLAIELAAARIRAFSVEEILKRLEADYDFLESGKADLPARQRTLRATAMWSYGLLAKSEKESFRALGVFRSRFSLESAETVLADSGKRRSRIAGDIASLVEKSLLVREEGEGGTGYRMLETLRAYAREKLETGGEAQAIAAAHARRFLYLVERGRDDEAGEAITEEEYFRRVDREYPDIAAAWEFLHASGDGQPLLSLTCGIHAYWRVRDLLNEGSSRLSGALALAGENADPCLRAKALRSLAELRLQAGKTAEALDGYHEALSLSVAEGDAQGEAEASLGEAWVHYRSGNFALAREGFGRAKEPWPEGEDRSCARARALLGLGTVELAEGRLAESKSLLEESHRSLLAAGRVEAAAMAIGNLGMAEMGLGERSLAIGHFQAARTMAERLGDRESLMTADNNLGYFAAEDREHIQAIGHYRRLQTMARGLGRFPFLVNALNGEAESLVELGRMEEAKDLAEEAFALSAKGTASLRLGLGISLRLLARIHGAEGKRIEALELARRSKEALGGSGDALELGKTFEVIEALEKAQET